MCQTCEVLQYMERLESKILKIEMFEFNVWILKVENWNLYVKCLESDILRIKMSELKCVNI
jgi:hypothetical protein